MVKVYVMNFLYSSCLLSEEREQRLISINCDVSSSFDFKLMNVSIEVFISPINLSAMNPSFSMKFVISIFFSSVFIFDLLFAIFDILCSRHFL